MKMFLTLENILSDTKYTIPIPSKKSEKWKLCNINSFLDHYYQLVTQGEIEPFKQPTEGFWIYMLDGNCIKSHLPQSVHYEAFKEAVKVKNNPFSYLAATRSASAFEYAFSEDIKVDIYLHFSKASFVTSAFNILVKESVKAEVNLIFEGAQEGFVAHNSHVELFAKADLDLTHIYNFDKGGVCISQDTLLLHKDSRCKSFSFLYSGEQIQNFVKADLGFNSQLDVNSLLLGKEREKRMFSSDIKHKADKSESKIRSKQIVSENATAIFDATTTISKNTKATVAYQSNKALLLDETAQVHAKPHLEIYSDDLTASHGATVGELDEEAIAYLTSRGISEHKAKELLIEAFMNEILDTLSEENKSRIRELLGVSYA